MITKLTISNYKLFRSFAFECNPDLNILVGDNESGKSTLLEALNLALTRRLNGRLLDTELTPHLFNKACCDEYVEKIQAGENPDLPSILIELYFQDDPTLTSLKGINNLDRLDCPGVRLAITFDDNYRSEYEALLLDRSRIRTVPVEYYKVTWFSFANAALTSRGIPLRASFIDATTLRLQSGADYYLQNIINDGLEPKDRVGLSLAYRHLKELFGDEPAIRAINDKLGAAPGQLSSGTLKLSVDLSPRGAWETNLIPHLDDIPFHFLGKGQQNSLKILLALVRHASTSHIVLIEEPENHLSFSSMHVLLQRINEQCSGKQIFVTTHSAFVSNKLGLDRVALLFRQRTTSLARLPADTRDYFIRLPGYNTLRLILAKRSILVEGPSDDLVIQRAYFKVHGKQPIENGVDVISVGGLSFARFLDIAKELAVPTTVVTDNDGDYASHVEAKYASYLAQSHITICADQDDSKPTLEDHMLAQNGRAHLNTIFDTSYATDIKLLKYMKSNKTDWALKVLTSTEEVTFPAYVTRAVA